MKSIEKQNDDLVKRIVLARGRCEWCGMSDKQLHHHHIITRNSKAYRHDLDNIVCLCAGCHTMSPCSAHNDRTAFVNWIRTTDRAEWFDAHHIEVQEKIAGRTVTKWKPIKAKTIPDEEENAVLREILERKP